MTSKRFLDLFKSVMMDEEIEELQNGLITTVYFSGTIQNRLKDDLKMLKELNEDKIEAFEQMKAEGEHDELQGNPVFDNSEGYYKV